LPKSKFLQSEHVMRWPVDSIWVSERLQKVVYASYPWSWLDCLVYPPKGRPKRTHPFLGQRFYWCSSWFHLLVYILTCHAFTCMTIPVCLSSKLFSLCPLNQPQDSLNLQSEDVAELHVFSVGQRHIVQALGFAICVHTCLWRKIRSKPRL
jgi:hypothetical protein